MVISNSTLNTAAANYNPLVLFFFLYLVPLLLTALLLICLTIIILGRVRTQNP